MTESNGNAPPEGHLLFVWSTNGWTLREREGAAPARGETVEDGDVVLQVSKVGPSPLPGDRRPCAFVEPVF